MINVAPTDGNDKISNEWNGFSFGI